MNSHPHGISQLTTAHSRDLLSEGGRRQLAKTAPARRRPVLGQPSRLLRAWASRTVAIAGLLAPSARYARKKNSETACWTAPIATGNPAVTGETP
ncbi:MAG TPA: hypothetical protein VMF65_04995 [Acidimicrobiales bacterium]|nr:hypothetical protein [Acidimicrobiales bacterium]